MLSARHLQKLAREISGIDLPDPEAEIPLNILVDSLNREASLSKDGETHLQQRLARLLANRLRMARDYLAHPEIAAEILAPPIFIFGLPRSGTTKLQKLLSITGDFNALPLWMAHNPSLLTGDRDEDRTKRIDDALRYTAWIRATCPSIEAIHDFDCFEPEEVNPILEQGFRSAYMPAFATVPGYVEWFAQEPNSKQLDYIRCVLKYLQWQFCSGSTKPWVLKNPTFLGMEPDISAAFPGAKLIVTHRHPAAVIASSASLVVHFHKLYSDVDATDIAGPMMLGGQAWLARQHLQNRAGHEQLDIIDVAYGNLVTDDVGTAEMIYRRAKIPFSAQARKNILAWQETPSHKLGAHKYSLASFGLSPSKVEDEFTDYIETFAAYL